jgi:hypothetical protein
MVSVKFLDLAQNEVDDLFEAFEYKQKNLGQTFIQEIDNTLSLIKNHSTTWPNKSKHTKRCLIKGFHYGVVYQKVDDIIYVVAVMNLLKKPTHWASKSTACRIAHLPETIYIR